MKSLDNDCKENIRDDQKGENENNNEGNLAESARIPHLI
jgi:hypothetical protein